MREPLWTRPIESAPIAVGGVGGSGTRLVADILRGAGVDLGPDVNASLDNLWFTLLFVRPRWLPRALRRDDPAIGTGLGLFADAMLGRLRLSRDERAFLARATADVTLRGHDRQGHGRGRWALDRARSLRREGVRPRPAPAGWGWKEPSTFLLLGPVARHLGRARYVHVLRNGVDMAFSRNQQQAASFGELIGAPAGPHPTPAESLRFWVAANELARTEGRRNFGDGYVEVRFDELCTHPRETVETLLGALGIEVDGPTLDRLAALPAAPPVPSVDAGDLAALDPADVERVAEWGFTIAPRSVSMPALAPVMEAAWAAPRRLNLSVAMCTYQGARYLAQQLESIATQRRLPDELVVCDDGSTDETLGLVEAFAAAAPFPVRLHPSEGDRLGPAHNFQRALERCSGEVVALSDQDDAWLPHRLAFVEEAFESRPDLALIFTDADLMDERGRSLGIRLWEALGIPPGTHERFVAGSRAERVRVLGAGNLVTGATSAVRSSALDLVLPIPDGWIHDAWIGLLLAATAEVEMRSERTIRYRLHGGQQVGIGSGGLTSLQHALRRAQLVRRMTKRERPAFAGLARALAQARERLEERRSRYPVSPEVLQLLESRSRHFAARSSLARGRRWPTIRGELAAGRYHRYSNGWPSVAKDLLLLDRFGASP